MMDKPVRNSTYSLLARCLPLALLGASGQAWAVCAATIDRTVMFNAPAPKLTISASKIQPGTPLGGETTVRSSPALYNGCFGVSQLGFAALGTVVPGVPHAVIVRDTGTVGVGVAIALRENELGGAWVRPDATANKPLFVGSRPSGMFGVEAKLQFVATSAIAPGEYLLPAWDFVQLAIVDPDVDVPNSRIGGRVEDFTLVVTAPTCDVNVGDFNRQVDLPRIRAADFGSGNSAGATPFSLRVGNCEASTVSATYTFEGTPDASDPWRYANNRGSAQGVAVQLVSAGDGEPVRADGSDGKNARTLPVVSGAAQLDLIASYWKTGNLTAGTVRTAVTITMTYQ
jgi:major type 1 subunit fimbrin (pilin)